MKISNPFKFIRILPLLIVLAVVIGIGFFYYFHNKQREKYMQDKGFRSLVYIEKSINRKFGYIQERITSLTDSTGQEKTIHGYDLDTASLPKNSSAYEAIRELVKSDNSYVKVGISKPGNNSIIQFQSYDSLYPETLLLKKYHRPLNLFFEDIIQLQYFENVFLFDGDFVYHNFNTDRKLIKCDSTLKSIVDRDLNRHLSPYFYGGTSYLLFSIPIGSLDQEMYLGGLISRAKYNSRVRQVNPNLVSLVLFILGIILIFFPVWKLVFMNQFDEMDRSDVYLVGISIIAGIYFIITTIMSIYTHFYYGRENIEKNLARLSYNIDRELHQLFSESKEHLQKLDNILQYRVLKEDSAVNNPALFKPLKDEPIKNAYKFLFNESILVDSLGRIRFINFERDDELPRFKINKREYFGNALKSNEHYFTTDQKGRKYYFQSIYSYSTGNNEFAISTPAGKNKSNIQVIAVTHKLNTLQNPVLPKGYSFSVINKQGEVLLHSDSRKTLMENYISECEENVYLIDALENRQKSQEIVKYHGKDHMIYVTPVLNTPYNLVLMYNMHMQNMQDTRVYLYMFSFIVLNLLFFAVLIGITLFLFNKKSKQADIKFTHTWLFYHPSHKYKYYYLCLILFFTGLLYLFFLLSFNNLLLTILFSWAMITGTNICIFTILNGLTFNDLLKSDGNNKFKTPIKSFYLLNIIILLVILIHVFSNDLLSEIDMNRQILFYSSFFSWVVFIFLYLIRRSILNRLTVNNWYMIKKPLLTYPLFLLLWLGIIGIFPCLHLYKSVYNKERNLWTLNEVSEKTEFLERKIKNEVEYFSSTYDTTEIAAFYSVLNFQPWQDTVKLNKNHGYYLNNLSYENNINTFIIRDGVKVPIFHPDSVPLINKIFKVLRVNFQSFNERNYSLLNYPQEYQNVSDTLTFNRDLIFSEPLENAGISSEYHPSNFMTFMDHFIFYPVKATFFSVLFTVLLIILFIYFLWKLLVFILKNVAYYKFREDILEEKEGCPPLQTYKSNIYFHPRVYKPIYVFELNPGKKTGQNEALRQLIKKPESRYFKIIQCTSFERVHFEDDNLYLGKNKIINYRVKHVLINNLDYDIGNAEIFKNRLKILEWLYQHKSIRVTITSSFSLKRFEEIYLQLCQLNAQNTAESRQLETAWYKWVFLLRKFRFRIVPINIVEVEADTIEKNDGGEIQEYTGEAEIEEELNSLSFAWRSIYNDLDFKEKILLLDLVKDGIINIKNKHALNSLCKKGLISVRDKEDQGSIREIPILSIKRNSFRKFLSRLAEQGETKEIIDTIEKKGNWSNMKYLLIILIVGLIIFLGVVEQSIFDRFAALLGAAAAVIPLIFKLSQSFLFKSGESQI